MRVKEHERIPPLERGGAAAAQRPYPTKLPDSASRNSVQ